MISAVRSRTCLNLGLRFISIQLFNRRSTISLSGPFGEMRLGRDFTPVFWNDSIFDPFATNGVGTNIILSASGFTTQGATTNGFGANPTQIRASNSMGYFLPATLGGFYGQAMYAFDEHTNYDPGSLTPPTGAAINANPALANVGNNAKVGRHMSGRIGYANGPLDVAAAYGESTIASNYYRGTTTILATWNAGISYDFGLVKLFGEYSNNKVKVNSSGPSLGLNEPGANGWLLGATVPVGPGLIRMSYSTFKYNNVPRLPTLAGLGDPETDKVALGYVHNLSKRTALYATVARVNNKNGADLTVGGPNYYTASVQTGPVVPKCSTGYDFGIRHSF